MDAQCVMENCGARADQYEAWTAALRNLTEAEAEWLITSWLLRRESRQNPLPAEVASALSGHRSRRFANGLESSTGSHWRCYDCDTTSPHPGPEPTCCQGARKRVCYAYGTPLRAVS